MDPPSETALRAEREAQFIANIGAFMRRDFDAIEGSMRPDVVMELPGSSWLSGTYGGFARSAVASSHCDACWNQTIRGSLSSTRVIR